MSFGDDVREAAREADPLAAWQTFAAAVHARLAAGERTYGRGTFERPLAEIADELGAELLDQAAYAFIGWVRLRALRVRLASLEQVANGGAP